MSIEDELTDEERVWHQVAYDLVRDKYSSVYPYHSMRHTYQVCRRAHRLALAAGLSDRERVLVRIAASFHDVCVESRVTHGTHGLDIREYETVQNERASAALVLFHTRSVFPGFLRNEEYTHIRDAILGTTPAWSDEFKTVIQPQVHPDSHPVVHCVALADLGDAGMDTDEFTHTMFALFAEREVGLMRELVATGSLGEHGREILLSWLRGQIEFVTGRKRRTEEIEIPRFTSQVAPLFNQFEDSLALAKFAFLGAECLSVSNLTAYFLSHVNPSRYMLHAA